MTTVSLHKPKKLFKEISIPTCWNELDTAELHAIAKNLISPDADKAEGRAQIFMIILWHRVQLQGDKMPRNWEALLNLDDYSIRACYPPCFYGVNTRFRFYNFGNAFIRQSPFFIPSVIAFLCSCIIQVSTLFAAFTISKKTGT